MDEYYSQPADFNSALEHIQTAYQNQLDKTQKGIRKSLFISISIIVFFVLLFLIIQTDVSYTLIPLIFVVFIELFVILILKTNNKTIMINRVMNYEILQVYNSMNGTNLIYENKPKIPKTFNVEMGLFVKYAGVSTKYSIKDPSPSNPFEMMYCSLITSNGKSSTVHFDGIYVIFKIPNIPTQHLLSRGKPHLQGTKMVQAEGYEENVFVPVDHPEVRINPILYGIFQDLPNKFELKAYYVASNNAEVHIAFTPKQKQKLPEEFTYQTLQEFSTPLMNYLSYIEEVRIQILELAT